jgi:hypothetical protein
VRRRISAATTILTLTTNSTPNMIAPARCPAIKFPVRKAAQKPMGEITNNPSLHAGTRRSLSAIHAQHPISGAVRDTLSAFSGGLAHRASTYQRSRMSIMTVRVPSMYGWRSPTVSMAGTAISTFRVTMTAVRPALAPFTS